MLAISVLRLSLEVKLLKKERERTQWGGAKGQKIFSRISTEHRAQGRALSHDHEVMT